MRCPRRWGHSQVRGDDVRRKTVGRALTNGNTDLRPKWRTGREPTLISTELFKCFAPREAPVAHQVLERVQVVTARKTVDMVTLRAVIDLRAWVAVFVKR